MTFLTSMILPGGFERKQYTERQDLLCEVAYIILTYILRRDGSK